MSKVLPLLFISIALMLNAGAQPKTDDQLREILSSANPEYRVLKQVLSDPARYRLQLIYTRIDRDKRNRPQFTHFYYHYDPALYFNPASMVKLPVALLALEKINRLKNDAVLPVTTLQFDSAYERQVAAHTDSSSENGYPSIAHYIKRALLISENDPYNRLYQFVGQQAIHRELWKKGYQSLRMPRQFMGFTPEQNRYANPFRFLDTNGKILYQEPLRYNPDTIPYGEPILIGKGFMRNGQRINEPFDFTRQNFISLGDMQQMLQSVLFPSSVKRKQRFNLTYNDYRFMQKYLSQYPSETMYPKYDSSQYYDSYVKFFFRKENHGMPDSVRVFNKVGWAYGFLTDVSYVADFRHKVEYMLSATIYVNDDGILNDNSYEYDSVGYPFLYQLGQAIYQHELTRTRTRIPDLSELQITYDRRDPSDTRPQIRDADN